MERHGSFQARFFAPGLATAGEPVRGRFSGATLEIEDEHGVTLSVPVAAVNASVGGFEHETVFLEFADGSTRYSLQLVGAEAVQQVRSSAPRLLQGQLDRVGQGVRRQRWMWRAIFVGAIALGVSIGTVVLRYDAVVAWTAARMSPETERRLGQQVVAGLRDEGRLLEAGPAVQAIADIGNRLTAGSRYDYRWFVLIDKDVNAFAAPGGVVVVHSGLIQAATSADEIAGVLAHEVQHVELRHSLQNMINAIGWAALLTVVLGDVSAIAGVLIHQAGSMRFSRELEREADMRGLEALRRAGLPAQGMVSFFQRLLREDEGSVPLLSSHPATQERINRLESAIAAARPAPPMAPITLDWAALQRGLEDESPTERDPGNE
ncbi:MAG: M48 family metallopeptidase [Panacagrimonas sp.]